MNARHGRYHFFPAFLIQINCRPSNRSAPCFGQEIRRGSNMRTPPDWVFHVLTWSLAAIGLIVIAHMIPWPGIE
jgi:hypothetical protein